MKTQIHRHNGAALIVSLLLLTVLTLIGLTSVRTARMQTTMATNSKESSYAFEAAEAAMRDAEQFVANIVSVAAFDGNSGLLGEDDAEPDYANATSWSSTNSKAYSGTFPSVATQPRYIIKYLGTVINQVAQDKAVVIGSYSEQPPAQEISLFRITVRGTGRNDTSRVLIQSNYGRIF